MEFLTIVFSVLVLIVSIIFHELAHGSVADWMGDPTPRLAGRLTLNPLAHLEWMGSVVLPLLCVLTGSGFILGWAKPVPINHRMLKYQRWGPALVALAGPATNILIAAVCALGFRFGMGILPEAFLQMLGIITTVNIALAVFNMIPLPPLDGHHILGALIPPYQRWSNRLMQGYGFVIMVVVILFAGSIISPVISFFTSLFLF